MADLSSRPPAADVFGKLLRLQALTVAEVALANDRAAHEKRASLFSEVERGFLQRLVESAEESAAPSQEEFDQLQRLIGRVAESPYVPFPGMPRLKQMLRLVQSAST